MTVPHQIASEAGWLANDPAYECTWSPVYVIEQVRIPVLAIWSEQDTKIDPIRAAHAYWDALEQADNSNYRVETIPGVDHFLAPSETSCISEKEQTIERVLGEQGFTLEDLNALDKQDPVLLTLVSAWPYAPEYLDLMRGMAQDLNR